MSLQIRFAAAILFSVALSAASASPTVPLQIKTIPVTPLIEIGREQQLLNFDIVVRNPSGQALTLLRIEAEALDLAGQPISRKRVDDNGFPSSIETVPDRSLPARGELGIFNPLYAWPKTADLARLRYTLTFTDRAGATTETATLSVTPRIYSDKTRLIVPLKGRLLVDDGHDFYAHHRRQDLSAPEVAQAGVIANPMRYALDFVFVDEHGAAYHGNPNEKMNWLGYGQPVTLPPAVSS